MSVLDKLRLDGKVAIMTGAGRGLGRVMTLALAEAGADIVAAARTQAQIAETAALVRARGRRCLAVQTDVTDSASVNTMVAATLADFGRIDILVNNAGGASSGWNKPVEALTDEQWRAGIDLNVTGAFYCCRAVLPHMMSQGGGKIINITSGVGVRAMRHNYMYATGKAGMINFTRALALNYADKNIQINLILPGIFPHEDPALLQFWQNGKFIPVGRVGKDEELGPACVFLASSAADYMTGEMIALEGGGLAGGEVPTGFAPLIPLAGGAQ
ncbi:MAG TPA: SDR family NAD(P)-dependent oxidoreductase [Candidatus Binatia bacterium]|jgi:NAD(P)-dependent dehydrogenase (short-subunit alcohol dehydrogenase family)|nr:SDR family NAD(P)-dependent oxidoreductase [Candidatus Binatia bacterium]